MSIKNCVHGGSLQVLLLIITQFGCDKTDTFGDPIPMGYCTEDETMAICAVVSNIHQSSGQDVYISSETTVTRLSSPAEREQMASEIAKVLGRKGITAAVEGYVAASASTRKIPVAALEDQNFLWIELRKGDAQYDEVANLRSRGACVVFTTRPYFVRDDGCFLEVDRREGRSSGGRYLYILRRDGSEFRVVKSIPVSVS
jgi:hypothetical protein